MKKQLFFLLLAVISLVACDKEDNSMSTITGYNPDQLNQTFYADQTNGQNNFTFTTAEAWTAQVSDLTAAPSSKATGMWVTIDPAQGGAGTNAMKIKLEPNLTGADRKAKIKIVCGSTTITVSVEQKSTTESGDEPEQKNKRILRIDVKDAYINDYTGTEYTIFKYDGEKLTEIKTTETESYKNVLQHTWVTTTTLTHEASAVSFVTKEREDEKSEKLLVNATAQLENGRITSGSREGTDYDKIETGEPWNDQFKLSYDNNGYLVKNERDEGDSDKNTFSLTWSGGNYTKVVWGNGGTDEAMYGNTAYKNKTNLDLNAFLILNSEGFDFSFGEPDKIFALCGYTGKRSAGMATKLTESWGARDASHTGIKEFRYEFNTEGYPSKIFEYYLNTVTNQMEFSTTYIITYE